MWQSMSWSKQSRDGSREKIEKANEEGMGKGAKRGPFTLFK